MITLRTEFSVDFVRTNAKTQIIFRTLVVICVNVKLHSLLIDVHINFIYF